MKTFINLWFLWTAMIFAFLMLRGYNIAYNANIGGFEALGFWMGKTLQWSLILYVMGKVVSAVVGVAKSIASKF